jgi:hypothetical protein
MTLDCAARPPVRLGKVSAAVRTWPVRPRPLLPVVEGRDRSRSGQHFTDEGRARDLAREAYLRLRGIRVLRFTDREILVETKRVLENIWAVISRERAAPSPRPSPPLGS